MKILKNIILFLLIFFLGYFTSSAEILTETSLGQTLDNVVYNIVSLSDPEGTGDKEAVHEVDTTDLTMDTSQKTSSEDSSSLASEVILPREADGDMDLALIEEEIFEYVNVLRSEQGLHPLKTNDTLKQAARKRAVESSVSFSHTRPSGQETFTILAEEEFFYPYQSAGENLGMATAHGDEETMAQFLFQGWVDSEGHYEAMIHPDFQEIGIGAYMSDNLVYAAQLFGTQRY